MRKHETDDRSQQRTRRGRPARLAPLAGVAVAALGFQLLGPGTATGAEAQAATGLNLSSATSRTARGDLLALADLTGAIAAATAPGPVVPQAAVPGARRHGDARTGKQGKARGRSFRAREVRVPFDQAGPAPVHRRTIRLAPTSLTATGRSLVTDPGTWRVERSITRVVHVFDLPSSPTADSYLACSGSGNLPANGYGGATQSFTCYRVDRTAGTQVQVPLPDDWFCSAAVHDANGDIVTAGGTEAYPNGNKTKPGTWAGSKESFRYHTSDGTIDQLGDLAEPRWYPNVFKNQDNDIFIHGGLDDGVKQPGWEVLRNGATTWQTLPFTRVMNSYADMELIAPDTFAYTGALGAPSSQTPFVIDMNTYAVKPTPGLRDQTVRRAANALLLYPAQAERVLVSGGGSKDGKSATDKVDMIDYSTYPAATPTWTPRASLPTPMMFVQLVNLPNGQVFATGGSRVWRSGDVLWAGFYDPATDQWQLVTPPVAGRDYHSNLWVNTDGTVSISGGNPALKKFESRVETYSPWYTSVPRPTLSLASLPAIAPGETLPELAKGGSYTVQVTVPPGEQLGYVTLDSARASTHDSSDPGQAMFDVPVVDNGDGTATITIPNTFKLVPGAFKLTAVTASQVPSTSLWVKIV